MGRPLNRRDLRAEAEAAEARGIPLGRGAGSPSRTKADSSGLKPKPSAAPRMKIVWAVCDLGGRTVAKYEFAQKAEAEARIVELKAKGKGNHFLRSLKEPIGWSGTSSPE